MEIVLYQNKEITKEITMPMTPLLSVILPVFNAEKFLATCINSLLDQSYENIEIIIIDDGSTDNSLRICKQYKDTRISLIHIENSGVNAARMAGFAKATGDYITFIDADDAIERNAYTIAMKHLTTHQGDMVAFDYYLETTITTLQTIEADNVQASVICGKDIYDNFVSGVNFGGTLWNKIWRRKCLENINFRTDIFLCEDSVFVWDSLSYIEKVIYLDTKLYHYRITATNATHSSSYNKYLTAIVAWNHIINDASKLNLDMANYYSRRARWIIKCAESALNEKKDASALVKLKEELAGSGEIVIRHLSLRERISFILLSRSNYKLFKIYTYLFLWVKKIYLEKK